MSPKCKDKEKDKEKEREKTVDGNDPTSEGLNIWYYSHEDDPISE
jgi:hypothetical protein